jgi:hypothetical protein
MLTEQEQKFMKYWETNRDRDSRLPYQLMAGLPLGLCFGLPILVSFVFRSWYKWLPFVSTADLAVVAVAVLGIVIFFSIFRQKYIWERREQEYRELLARQDRTGTDPAGTPPTTTTDTL